MLELSMDQTILIKTHVGLTSPVNNNEINLVSLVPICTLTLL